MVISEPAQAQTALALAEELQLESVFVPESVVEDTMQELSKTEPENTAQGLSESVTVDATQDLSNKTNENRLVVVAGSDTEAQRQLLEKDTVKAIALVKETENISNINTIKAELENENCTFNRFKSSLPFDSFKVDDRGLIPVIVQDFRTAEVLMMAYMNKEAYDQTLREGVMTYWSRSRQELWRKGDTSGHYQYVKSLDIDCDKDTILAKVEQIGAACHTGNRSCFYTNLASKAYDGRNPMTVFDTVMATITDRKANPKEGSYTNYLFDQGIDKILKKVGEEATEIVIAAKNPDSDELKYEICDFLYHMMVLMAEREVTWKDITKELAERH